MSERLTESERLTDLQQKRQADERFLSHRETHELLRLQEREIERLREIVESHERSIQEGHPSPCNLGPLCPYCEIERLRAEIETCKKGFMRSFTDTDDTAKHYNVKAD